MDISSFLIEKNIAFPLFVLSTLVFVLLLITKRAKLLYSSSIKSFPPCPPQLPIIGNLHQVGKSPHISIANFALEYGPLISLRLGKQFLVVASTPEAAKGILKTQDRLLSSRSVPTAFQHSSLLPHSLLWSECNHTWKTLRTLCRTEIFSTKAMEDHSKLREEKLGQLTNFLHRNQGRVINTETIIFTTLLNTLSCIVLGKDLLDLNVEHKDEHGIGGKLKESLLKINEYGGHVRDFGSFFPIFQIFDLQGIKRGSMKHMKKVFASWEDIITERRDLHNSPTLSPENAKSFLNRLLENGFSNDQINQLVTELFIAGTNTTTTAIVWTMTELVRNKEVMSRLNEEMEKVIDSEKITESQLSKLPYLHACIKEALRLHPPVPFLLPHMAAETCEVMNYTIPKNARVFVNVWAIGRDPNIWEDPLSFRPERFLESKFDLKGQDFELLPFGSGRRICPGLLSGVKSLEFLVASLIHEFDLALPNDEDPTKLDMNEKFGLTLKKEKPLNLIFKHKCDHENNLNRM